MIANATILIVAADPKLPEEFEAALGDQAGGRAVVHVVPDFRHGVEAARSRRPDLAVIEMSTDLRALTVFTEEVAAGAPETVVVAAFSPNLFGPDVSEGAILIEAMRAGVRDFLRRPLSSADVRQLLGRLHRPAAAPAGPPGRIVSILSNKGGVGKSTVSVNLACGLATRHPGRVLLLDASLQMGVCAAMLDLQPEASLTDAAQERDRLDEVLLRQLATPHPCGLHLLPAPADALEAARVDDDVMARILTLGRRAYDFVIVDSFPLLDRIMMTVLDLSDRTYLVLDSVVPTVLGMAKLVQVLDELGFPRDRQRLILNRYSSFAGNLRPEDVAQRLGREVDHVLPYEKKLLIAANIGQPYILGPRRWFGAGLARALDRLVDEVDVLEVEKAALAGKAVPKPSSNGTAETQQLPSGGPAMSRSRQSGGSADA